MMNEIGLHSRTSGDRIETIKKHKRDIKHKMALKKNKRQNKLKRAKHHGIEDETAQHILKNRRNTGKKSEKILQCCKDTTFLSLK